MKFLNVKSYRVLSIILHIYTTTTTTTSKCHFLLCWLSLDTGLLLFVYDGVAEPPVITYIFDWGVAVLSAYDPIWS